MWAHVSRLTKLSTLYRIKVDPQHCRGAMAPSSPTRSLYYTITWWLPLLSPFPLKSKSESSAKAGALMMQAYVLKAERQDMWRPCRTPTWAQQPLSRFPLPISTARPFLIPAVLTSSHGWFELYYSMLSLIFAWGQSVEAWCWNLQNPNVQSFYQTYKHMLWHIRALWLCFMWFSSCDAEVHNPGGETQEWQPNSKHPDRLFAMNETFELCAYTWCHGRLNYCWIFAGT